MEQDKSAIVSKKANIAEDVEIGPNAVIEDGVKIAKGCKIWANAYICKGTEIGKNCQIHIGAVIGHEPQDLAYKGGQSFVKIGDNNVFREYATVHRGTKEGSSTIIGNDNYFMALSHIAHNCKVGSNVIICNSSVLGGYVEVEDKAFISAHCAMHQFCRIGTLSMIGGVTRIDKDVPPYMLCKGDSTVVSYNVVGLRRAGFSEEKLRQVKEAYRILYRSGLNVKNAIEKTEKTFNSQEIKHLIEFIKSSKRGICAGKNHGVRIEKAGTL